MPGPGAFYGIACTGGRWDLVAPSAKFKECGLSTRYPVWWGRSKLGKVDWYTKTVIVFVKGVKVVATRYLN